MRKIPKKQASDAGSLFTWLEQKITSLRKRQRGFLLLAEKEQTKKSIADAQGKISSIT